MDGPVKALQCGVKFKPPALVVTYEGSPGGEMRKRTMPVRSLTKGSQVARVAADMKASANGRKYLGGIKERQLLKMLTLLKDHLAGLSLNESLEKNAKVENIDPEEDLNKVDDETLRRKKAVMDDTFNKNSVKPGDPDFAYDKEVDFSQDDEPIEAASWSDDEEGMDF